MSIRAEKVASVIKRAIAMPLSNLAKEHSAGLVSVTSVRLSPDLQIARIFVSIYGAKISQSKFLAILDEQKGHLRTLVGSEVRMRFTPELKFFIDDTLDQMEHIKNLVETANKSSTLVKYDENEYDSKQLPETKK